MNRETQYPSTGYFKELNEKGQYTWQRTIENHKLFAMFIIMLVAPILLLDIWAYMEGIISMLILFLGLSGGILIILSVAYYSSQSSYKLLMVGLILFSVHMRIIWIIFGIIITYYSYHIIKNRQIAKIEKYANMTPMEIAKLRDNNTGKNPICLYTNMDAGHSGMLGRYQTYKETALIYAFILDVLSSDKPNNK